MILIYILAILIFIFMVEYCIVCKFFKKANYNNGKKSDVIIIPGYPANKDGTISPILRERVNKASELYHSGIAPVIICSGGAVANKYVEADVMAQALSKLNVKTCDIIIENTSVNTYGNFIMSNNIMTDRGFKTAVIVSSPWHLRKASTYASRLKLAHTIEKSKCPHEYIIGIGIIYLYSYSQLLISNLKYFKISTQSKKEPM